MPVNVLLLFSLRSAIMCTNADLKISLHVCVRKIAIIIWKFHILNKFFSYLPLKFYLFLKSRQYFMFFIFISKYFNSFLDFNHCISQKVRLNFLLVALCSLLVTSCSLLVARYFLLVARYFLLVARCSLLFTCCSLLVACYFLLVARCSLLSARCSLILCSLLITFCSLLFARCSLLFARLLVAYCVIKLLWTAKKWFGYYETPSQIFSLHISEIFVTFSGWWFSKFSQNAKPFSKLA